MSYKEKVQDKIKGSDQRSKERNDLWQTISEAYEQDGVDQVESVLSKKIEDLKNNFEERIKKLEKML